MWDQWHLPKGSPALCMCGCVTSMVATYIDYSAEVSVSRASPDELYQASRY
jgi:hypothetical protein